MVKITDPILWLHYVALAILITSEFYALMAFNIIGTYTSFFMYTLTIFILLAINDIFVHKALEKTMGWKD